MKALVRVQARGDFPSYELRDYEVRWQVLDGAGAVLGHDSRKIDLLRPGEERAIEFQCAAEQRRGAQRCVLKSSGPPASSPRSGPWRCLTHPQTDSNAALD